MSKIFCTNSTPVSSPDATQPGAPYKFPPAFTGMETFFANRNSRMRVSRDLTAAFDAPESKKRKFDVFQDEDKENIPPIEMPVAAPRTPVRIAFCNFAKARRLVGAAGLNSYFVPHSQVRDDDITAPPTSFYAASMASPDAP